MGMGVCASCETRVADNCGYITCEDDRLYHKGCCEPGEWGRRVIALKSALSIVFPGWRHLRKYGNQ